MRIKQLKLIAFGSFKEEALNFAAGNCFNLVYGLNEAGKSTILRAIRDFFYDIPLRSPDAYLYPAGKMRLQAILETAEGREFKLIRRKGRKNTLLDEAGRPLDENVLQQHLGAIDREAFALMFGLDHNSLRRGGEALLGGKGALGEALFEAASGIGDLRKLFLELDREAGDLFKPTGSRPPVNATINHYREIKKKVGDLSLSPRHWSELEERYGLQKNEVANLREKEKEITRRKTRLERLKETLPLVARRDKILEEVDLLGDLPVLPAGFRERRLELIHQRDGALQDREQARNEKKDLEKELASIVVPEGLLGEAPAIQALLERLDTYRSHGRDIPSLEGRISELARETLALLRRLGPSFASLEEAETLRLPLTGIEEMRQLAGEQPLLIQEWATDRERVEGLEQQLAGLAAKKEELGSPKDAGNLGQALKPARKRGDLEGELQKTRSGKETLEAKLAHKLGALGLWSGTPAQLQRLPLPSAETVRLFEERFKKLHDQSDQIERDIAAGKTDLESDRSRLVSEKVTGAVSEAKLAEARQHRQQGWHLVRRAWFEGGADRQEERDFCAGRPLHLAYEMSVTGADRIADRLRCEAGQAERAALLQDQIERCQKKLGELAEQKTGAAAKSEALEQEWQEAWKESTVTPLTPPEMLPWLGRCQEIRSGLEQLDELTGVERELIRLITAHREGISSELLKLDEPGAEESETLEALIERAQELSEKYRDRAGELQRIGESCKETERELAGARRKATASERALTGWQEKWAEALGRAGLSARTGAKAVLAYLESLEKLFQNRDELGRKQADLDRMKTDRGDFEGRLQTLLVTVAPDLVGRPADHAASQLHDRVNRAQRDRDRRESLQGQADQAEKASRDARKAFDEAAHGIEVLRQQARCPEEAAIPEVIEKVEQLAGYRKDLAALEERLLSHGGGLSLEAVVGETGEVDGDALPGLLEEVGRELGENRREQDELNRTFGATREEYREKIAGSSMEALEAAEEAQGVLAGLGVQTEQYLRLRLASIVLRRSIDRYREENQSPVIRAAGVLFARLTGGSFDGLEVDFDDQDHPVLLGTRPTKEKISVEGMSDGTLDQLYLSLRLAGLERYLEQNEPLPFILDDLLVNFDDIRSGETLQVLGEFAQKTQVLFFTHHRGLVDLAREVIPGSRMINLG